MVTAARAGRWLPLLLAASLIANAGLAWRWLGRPARAPGVAPGRAPETGGSADRGRSELAALAEAWRRPFPGLRAAAAGGGPVALDPCLLRRSSLQAQLGELEDMRDRLLPAAHRFEQAPPNPELTADFAAALARQLPPDRRDRIQAECRDRWCRLAGAPAPELAQVAADLRQSEWVGENLHLVEGSGDVLFERHPPGAVRSSELLQQALQDFEASGAVAECQAQHRAQGTLDAQVSLGAPDPGAGGDDPGFTVQSGGSLSGTPLGRCIDARIRQTLAAMTLPPRFAEGHALIQLPRP